MDTATSNLSWDDLKGFGGGGINCLNFEFLCSCMIE